MGKYPAPNVPFVEAHNIGGPQKPTAIFLSLSSTTSDKGAALGIATYHHSKNAPAVSHHYIVDEAATYRCVPVDRAAYASPRRSISVLICAEPREHEEDWNDPQSHIVVDRTADLVSDLLLAHKIRLVRLGRVETQRWLEHRWRRRGGYTVQTLGVWPEARFLMLLDSHIARKV